MRGVTLTADGAMMMWRRAKPSLYIKVAESARRAAAPGAAALRGGRRAFLARYWLHCPVDQAAVLNALRQAAAGLPLAEQSSGTRHDPTTRRAPPRNMNSDIE